MKKIAGVFTGFDTSLYKIIEQALENNLQEINYKLLIHANPDLIAETLKAGYVTENVATGLLNSFLSSVSEGADIILSVCSTMGDVAEAAQPLFKMIGVPIVRIDEAMMHYAVCTYKRIALVASCQTIMLPNKRLMEKSLKAEESDSSVTYIIIDEMQGKSGTEISDIVIKEMLKYEGDFDVVVMTQASMAPFTADIAEKLKIPVLSSSDFGAKEISEIIKNEINGVLI
jgi:aspartate/glutamate racemase